MALKSCFFRIIVAVVIVVTLSLFAWNKLNLNISFSRKPNIVLIVVETLRADHVGCYGYNRNTTPFIDKSAGENGIIFNNFFSVAPWTNPAVASLFTGFYPQSVFAPLQHKQAIRQTLPEESDTIAEIMNKSGYYTIGLIDHPGINSKLKYNQGFAEFIQLQNIHHGHRWQGIPKKDLMNLISKKLKKSNNKPKFIYLHLLYPHLPYEPFPEFKNMFGQRHQDIRETEKQGMINMYDAEIRYTDEVIKEIYKMLKNYKLLNNTWLIITADHGEGFWEHGLYEHGNSLYNELLKIPLIIYPAGGRNNKPREINHFLSNIDIFPTMLDIAGINPPKDIHGKSLLGYLAGEDHAPGLLFSESPHSRIVHALSCQDDTYKLIYKAPEKINNIEKVKEDIQKTEHYTELYNIKDDPNETDDIHSNERNIVEELGVKLIEHHINNYKMRKRLKQIEKELDKETIERLKSIGYLN